MRITSYPVRLALFPCNNPSLNHVRVHLKNHFHELNRHREADFENPLGFNPEIHMGSLWVEDPSLCAMVKVVAFYWAWEKSTHLLMTESLFHGAL